MNSNKKNRKLSLKRDTLRRLSHRDAALAAGGVKAEVYGSCTPQCADPLETFIPLTGPRWPY